MDREYVVKRLLDGKEHSEIRIVIRLLLDERKIERGVIVTAGEHINSDSTKAHTILMEYLQSEIDEFLKNVDKATTKEDLWYENDDIMIV